MSSLVCLCSTGASPGLPLHRDLCKLCESVTPASRGTEVCVFWRLSAAPALQLCAAVPPSAAQS